MNLSESIKSLSKELHVTTSELARRTGQSQQNLGQKLNRGTVSYDEFIRLLDAMGVRFDYSFVLPSGDSAGLSSENEKVNEKVAMLEARIEYEKRSNEYLLGLARDIRTALYSASGNTDRIERYYKGSDGKILESIGNIHTSLAQIENILSEGFKQETTIPEREEGRNLYSRVNIHGRRILLADDNEMNREITRDVLEDNGLLVEEAENGKQALNAVMEHLPGYYDCVLMDVQMPEMDGLQATREIRALPNRVRANVPVIAMTANAFEEDRKKSFDAGMDAHLTKPVEAQKLIQVMTRFL